MWELEWEEGGMEKSKANRAPQDIASRYKFTDDVFQYAP